MDRTKRVASAFVVPVFREHIAVAIRNPPLFNHTSSIPHVHSHGERTFRERFQQDGSAFLQKLLDKLNKEWEELAQANAETWTGRIKLKIHTTGTR